jgi:hypothetical protein
VLQLLLPVAAIALVIVVFRAVAQRCGNDPTLRKWFAAAGMGALVIAAALIPWLLAKLKPPFSESPSGLFVILGKGIVVAGLCLVGLGSLLGATIPAGARRRDPPG